MNDASREAFEAWWKSILRLPHEGKHSAFMGWQASRKQALEDAIQAAQPEDAYQDGWFDAKADAVRKIKELK